MSGAWWDGPLVGLDLETTAPSPTEARVVTAALVVVLPNAPGIDAARAVERRTWLVNPGVPIPDEAAAVHGITTEHAEAEGVAPAGALLELAQALEARAGGPLIVFNARYDLTVLDREWARHGITAPPGFPWLVVDPFVLDKHLDRYRRSYPHGHTPESAAAAGIASSRTLTGMCAHYRVTLDGAHDAAFDALAAVRLAWRVCSSADVMRRTRSGAERAELAQLREAWSTARNDLARLHRYQRALALEERERFAEYKRSIGEHDAAAQIESEHGWPVLA